MRKANIICSLIILIIGTMAVYDGIKLGVIGWGAAGPRPGLYQFVLGMGIIIGTLIVLGQAFFKSKNPCLMNTSYVKEV